MDYLARVFPRKTKATPDDDMAFFDIPDLFTKQKRIDAVHVSVTFKWDILRATYLAEKWSRVADVIVGGPAMKTRGEEFVPGKYLKKGYVITSRGCPNNCWFCEVPKRDGTVRELPITQGYNVLDDNLLACSDEHISRVFNMLEAQKGQPYYHAPEFTGGLEAKRLKDWQAQRLYQLKIKQLFMAYDTPDDYEPLVCATKKLHDAGFPKTGTHAIRAYVLVGHPRDTFEAAEKRLIQCVELGIFPMAMLYRNNKETKNVEWARFQREWASPILISRNIRKLGYQL